MLGTHVVAQVLALGEARAPKPVVQREHLQAYGVTTGEGERFALSRFRRPMNHGAGHPGR